MVTVVTVTVWGIFNIEAYRVKPIWFFINVAVFPKGGNISFPSWEQKWPLNVR